MGGNPFKPPTVPIFFNFRHRIAMIALKIQLAVLRFTTLVNQLICTVWVWLGHRVGILGISRYWVQDQDSERCISVDGPFIIILYIMLSQQHRVSITKSKPKHKPLHQDKQTLFETLNTRIEEHAKVSHSHHSCSTRSPHDSDEEKDLIMLKTPGKNNFEEDYNFCIKEPLTRYTSPVKLSPMPIEIDLIEEIKLHAKEHAKELNLKFQSIIDNCSIELNKELDISSFVKEFDRCFEMVETLQRTYTSIRAIIPDIQEQFQKTEFEDDGLDQTELVDVYTKELLENSKMAKSLCELIGVLMNTSLFQNQTQEVIESLLALADLDPKKSKVTKKNLLKSSILEYKELVKKIQGLDQGSHRMPIRISESFVDSLKKKQPKGKKNK